MPPRRTADDDEFKKHERLQEEILWLQDFVFNMKKVPFPTILLVGKRFSGKSYTSVSIAAKFDVPRWAAWCGTKDTEDFWADRFESNATVKGPDEKGKSYLINIIRYQQRKGRLYKKVLKQPFPRKFTMGLIFDDVTSKRQFRKGEILEDLFSNGRHYHTVIIISAQYLKQLPPAVRLNTDYMFMMHNTKRTIKVLYEDYVEEPDEFGMFLDLIRSVTGQKDAQGNDMFNALVYDNVKKTQKLEEIFKIYRNEGEQYLDNVKLGDESWREYNKTHFKDEDYELQVREYRKQQRILRLEQHRQNQLERRNNPLGYVNPLGQADLDYYDDTDSEDDTESKHDTVTLTHRSGPSLKINFHKHAQPSPELAASGSAINVTDTRWNLPDTSATSGGIPGTMAGGFTPQAQHQPYQTYPKPGYPQQQQQPYGASSIYPQQQQQTYGGGYVSTYPQPTAQPMYGGGFGQTAYRPPAPTMPYGASPFGQYPQQSQALPYGAAQPYGALPNPPQQPQFGQYQKPAAYPWQQQQASPYGASPYGASPYGAPRPPPPPQQPELGSWGAQQGFIRSQSQYVPSAAGFGGASANAGMPSRIFL